MHLYKSINRRRNINLKRKGAMFSRAFNKSLIIPSGERRFLELMNGSGQGILIQSPAGLPLFVNQVFADSLGYSVDELMRSFSLDHLYSDRENRKLRAHFKRVSPKYSSSGPPSFCNISVRHKLGFDIILHYSIGRVKWLGRSALLILSRDVTEEKASMKALSLSEERFRDFAESATDWCWELDKEFRVVFVSSNFERIAGFQKKTILGKTYFNFIRSHFPDIWFSDEQIKLSKKFESLLYEGVEFANFEFFWFSPCGGVSDVRCSGKPIFDESGACKGYRGTVCDISEEKNLSEQLNFYAAYDSLTKLSNRRHFDAQLSLAIDKAIINNDEHALVFMDLDRFKIVNDVCGHAAGDELLQQIANMLCEVFGERDSIGRLGGDEFAAIIWQSNIEKALKKTKKLHKKISQFKFIWEGKAFVIGVSVGVISINRETESVSSLLQNVDSACYIAKETGRNKTHVFSEDDDDLLKRRGEMHWAGRITQALERDDFTLYAQQISSLGGYEAPSYELLLRMREGDELVTPDLFLPAAERFDLSINVDKWVVRTAFKWLSRRPVMLSNFQGVFINLSGKTVGQKIFLDYVISMFNEYSIPPEKICFEITETTAISNLSEAVNFINDLKRIGCYFAIDDFGSGVASFSYLKNLPVDYLKIDGAFIRDICSNEVSLAMVKSINDISHVMGKKTIAEFVEDDATFAMLKNMGVDYAQGYTLGQPFSLEGIGDTLPFPQLNIEKGL